MFTEHLLPILPVAAYSQVVDLALLDLPHIMESTGFAYFTIWGYSQNDNCIWPTGTSRCFLKRLLWISSQPIVLISPRACQFPPCLSLSFCILHRQIKFPKTVMAMLCIFRMTKFTSIALATILEHRSSNENESKESNKRRM